MNKKRRMKYIIFGNQYLSPFQSSPFYQHLFLEIHYFHIENENSIRSQNLLNV